MLLDHPALQLVLIAMLIIGTIGACLRRLHDLRWLHATPMHSTPTARRRHRADISNARIAAFRANLVEAWLRSSEWLLVEGDPNWEIINILGVQCLDVLIEEHPDCVEAKPFINRLTINAALNSPARTLTVGGEYVRFTQRGERS